MLAPISGNVRLLRVWLAAGGLCSGVLWGYSQHSVVPAVALGAAGTTMVGFRRKPGVLLTALVLVAFGAGALDASLRSGRASAASVLAADIARCHIRGRVLEDQGALGTLVAVQLARCVGFAPVVDAGSVMVTRPVGAAGAGLSATGTLIPLGHDSFDVARERAGASGLFDAAVVHTQSPSWWPLRMAASIRRGLMVATRPLPSPRRGLVRGLAIGDTTDLDQATIEDFRRAGLSHLLAVSGENLAMVLGALALLIRRLHYRLRMLAYLAAIGLFVLVVGPQPSVLRAAVMGAVMVAAVGTGYRAQPLAVLATALIVVIGFRPALVFSVGLQLSAAATGGIVLWTKLIERALRPLPRVIALPLAVTISAQSAVAPILVATFGQLSLVSPVANLLAFPAVAAPTVLGLSAGVASVVSGTAARLLAVMAGPFAGWIAFVGSYFGQAPMAAVDLPKTAAWLLAAPVIVAAVAAAARDTE